jgi:hypothetical protein
MLDQAYNFFMGMGAGAVIWYSLGHYGIKSFLLWQRRAKELRNKGVLNRSIVRVKYNAIGLVALLAVSALAKFYFNFSGLGGRVGVLSGIGFFLVHSIVKSAIAFNQGWGLHDYVDFIDANQRWVNGDRASLFQDKKSFEENG